MGRITLMLLLSLAAVSCGQLTGSPKVSDTKPEPGTCPAPMSLPDGYEIVYDLVDVTDPSNEVLMYDDVAFTCYLERSAGGRAARYCGFVIEVYEDYFSFDTLVDPYDGSDADGIGNDEGATINTSYAGYLLEYRITHTGSF